MESLQLVAQGKNWDDYNLLVDGLENLMEEGQNGRLLIQTDRRFSEEELEELKDDIEHQGVTIFDVYQDGNMVVADFQKNLWPLLIVGSLLLIPVAGFGWRLMLQSPEQTFQQVLKYIVVPIGVIAIVGTVLYMSLRKPGDKAGGQLGVGYKGAGVQAGGYF
jgi:hypothetical protein